MTQRFAIPSALHKRPPQLLDLVLCDQRVGARLFRLGIARFRKLGFRCKLSRALGQYHGVRGGEIGRQAIRGGINDQMASNSQLIQRQTLSPRSSDTRTLGDCANR